MLLPSHCTSKQWHKANLLPRSEDQVPIHRLGVGVSPVITHTRIYLWGSQQFHFFISSDELIYLMCLIIIFYCSGFLRRYHVMGYHKEVFKEVSYHGIYNLGKYSLSNMLKTAILSLVLTNVYQVFSQDGIWLFHRGCCTSYILIQSTDYMPHSVFAVMKYKAKTPTYVTYKSKTISLRQVSC